MKYILKKSKYLVLKIKLYFFNLNMFKQIINKTRWVKLNDLNFDIINWSVKDKFIDILH